MHTLLRFLRASVKTSRLALPKLGVGWMFALLTINFNRITIEELNVAGVAVGTLLAAFASSAQIIIQHTIGIPAIIAVGEGL